MAKPFDLTKFSKEITKKLGVKTGFHDPKTWIHTGSYALNYRISGDFFKGVPLDGKVTVFAGESGCLPADSWITVRIDGAEHPITIAEMREMFHEGTALEIATPDGWQTVSAWFDKGVMPCVAIETEDGRETVCATNHLLEVVRDGSPEWVPAELVSPGDVVIVADDDLGITEDTISKVEDFDYQECYDFTVDHPNHRYWGDGFSSHNSGKSYIVSGNMVKWCLENGIQVIILDTEDGVDGSWISKFGVDTNNPNLLRMVVSSPDDCATTIGEYMASYSKEYEDAAPEDCTKVMFVIDSLGMLTTKTEQAQFKDGEMKGDKGIKAKQLKALVSQCIRLFAGWPVGLVATNHSYKSQDMYNPDDIISGGCLAAGAEVWMADGSMKAIEDVTTDDVVKTMFGEQPVTNLWRYEKPTYTLSLLDGQTFECSPEHKFLVRTEDGMIWRDAKDLVEGDDMLSVSKIASMRTLSLIKKTFNETPKPVYDIEVANDEHYIIGNGVVSHNSGFIYASSIVVAMNKLKLKEDEEGNKTSTVNGIRAKVKVVKTRYAKPFEQVEIKIPYDTGMNPFSGIIEMFETAGILKKSGNRLEYIDPETGEVIKKYRKEWIADTDMLLQMMRNYREDGHNGVELDHDPDEDDDA